MTRITRASRFLGAATALHALLLGAGAIALSRKHPTEPRRASTEPPREESRVDVTRLLPAIAENRSEPSLLEGAESRVAPRDASSRGRRRELTASGRAGAPHASAAPRVDPVVSAKESIALEAFSRAVRSLDEGLGVLFPALGADDGGKSGGPSVAAAISPKAHGKGSWGEGWDYVVGSRRSANEGPASLPGSGASADEATLPRRVVDAVVGRSASVLRLCYERGRRLEPALAGQVLVRFAVDPGGSVVVAADGGSTIADPAVVRCVLAAFATMTFPARSSRGAVWATRLVAFPPGS